MPDKKIIYNIVKNGRQSSELDFVSIFDQQQP